MILLTDENTGNEVCKSFMTSTTEVGSNGTQTRVLLLVDTSAEGWMLEFQKECVSRTSIADDLLAALVDQELLRLRVPPDVDWPGQHTLRTRTFETTVPPPSHPHPPLRSRSRPALDPTPTYTHTRPLPPPAPCPCPLPPYPTQLQSGSSVCLQALWNMQNAQRIQLNTSAVHGAPSSSVMVTKILADHRAMHYLRAQVTAEINPSKRPP